jgi:transposase-like protein
MAMQSGSPSATDSSAQPRGTIARSACCRSSCLPPGEALGGQAVLAPTDPRSASAFSGCRFPGEVIALAVRWYLRFRLSYVDVAEWLAERGITVDPSTIYDWVHAFRPRFIAAVRRHRHPAGRTWRVDETLFKIGGRWRYAFRAIDQDGQIVDVLPSDHRDAASARAFFKQALASMEVTPTRVTMDRAACYPPALGAPLRAPGAAWSPVHCQWFHPPSGRHRPQWRPCPQPVRSSLQHPKTRPTIDEMVITSLTRVAR